MCIGSRPDHDDVLIEHQDWRIDTAQKKTGDDDDDNDEADTTASTGSIVVAAPVLCFRTTKDCFQIPSSAANTIPRSRNYRLLHHRGR